MDHEIYVSSFLDGITLKENLTGIDFEEIITPFVNDSIAVADGALDKAGLNRNDLTGILLAGGTSQIPLVQDKLKERFRHEPKIVANDLMWLIAKGAAVHHRDFLSRPGEETQQILGADLYIETATNGSLEPTLLVPARQRLPHTSSREFSVNSSTHALTIQLLSQSGVDKGEPTPLTRREVNVSGRQLTKIGVKVVIDKNKTIKVSVIDPTTKLPVENVEIQGDILSTAKEIRAVREMYGLQNVKSPPAGQDQRYAVGIDLGTTTCEAMVYDMQEKTFQRGIDEALPSRVFIRKGKTPDFTKKEDIGNIRHSLNDPNNFWNFKVHIGKDTAAAKYRWDEKYWPPEILSAYLLATIWEELQAKFGKEKPLYQAVITVPSDFSVDQNALVEKAAKVAGIANPILLTEPVAAALAYAEEYEFVSKPDQTFLIFDFGGGTTDVCIIKTKPFGKPDELGRNGNNGIGGENLTTEISDAIISRFDAARQSSDQSTKIDQSVRIGLRNSLKIKIDEAKVAISRSLKFGDE